MGKHTKFDIGLIVFTVLYNLFITAFALLWLFTTVLNCSKIALFGALTNDNILMQFSYLFFAGAIGGSFYCLRSLYQRLADAYTPQNINKTDDLPDPTQILNIRVWFYWFFYRPLQGGILAVVLVCLFAQGLLGLNGVESKNINSIYFQVGIGFLVGFGTSEVINKIEEVINVLFAKSSKTQANARETSQNKIKENE